MRSITDIKKQLTEIKQELSGQYHISSLGVFGSRARGDNTDDSDLDILVEFDSPVGIEFIELADELERRLKMPIDLVSKKGIRPQYLELIESDIIYV